MTIHVWGGSCHTVSLVRCLEVMVPESRVERHPSHRKPDVGEDDLLFVQRGRTTVWTPEEMRPNQILFPRIWFNAFHPDLVNVQASFGGVPPPLGYYHSTIVLYAWKRGLSVAQTAALFCYEVFERLGYFGFWEAAKRSLLDEGREVDFPLDAMLAHWERSGLFMYTPNHPALVVFADIARELLRRAGLTPAFETPEQYMNDPMLENAVWPVYPEIARAFGLSGSYAFKPPHTEAASSPRVFLTLDEFIERSFYSYRHMPAEALVPYGRDIRAYGNLEELVAAGSSRPADTTVSASNGRARVGSPYADLPSERFWRRAVARLPARDVDPVGTPPFTIDRRQRIATAGSCFAQHMSRALVRGGYGYYVAEPGPDGLLGEAARDAGYGVFSTRCGNVYTARQLRQLLERAYGTFAPREDAWLRPDGRYVDPFRPQIEPGGFANVEELRADRERHLGAVRTMFERLDVLIFTLGLTEAWRSRADGAVFPLAPGVTAGTMDPAEHEFVNFTTAEVRDDLVVFLAALAQVNPAAKVVLTVSPVPPIATYEPRHVLISATYTKAALRAAADEVERLHGNVWYCPSYEIVAGTHNRGAYYAEDLRTVTPDGVDHVMRLFLQHCAPQAGASTLDEAALREENRAGMDVVCDEEEIAYQPRPRGVAAVAVPAREHDDFLNRDAAAAIALDDFVSLRDDPMAVLGRVSMRAPVLAVLPQTMRPRAVVAVPCTVRNDGDVTLVSAGEHAIYLCYRWYDEHGEPTEVGASIHTPLEAPLGPGQSISTVMSIAAPRYAGRYRLRVALLQSQIAWFDDVDPDNGLELVVEVG
ncbi:MAG TPA: GSCFA domain-containing protein [Candidatus Elarobacter sp.]|jgi:hypothetical protein